MDFLSSLLEHYHRNLKDLEARNALRSFQSLSLPDGFPLFERTVARIEKAIKENEKTVIYGDYDVDGLTSSAIRKRTLEKRGLSCGFFIPSRYHEGYGLNKERVLQFKGKGYKLILTVDNGISATESIRLAKENGREVIVIDHHELPARLPDTPYIFTQRMDSFISYNCSAASLALFVSRRLLGDYDPYFVTLAGRAVFSDVRPLVGNNLVLARQRLKNLNKHRYPNLLSLRNPSGEITFDDVVFSLIPALNSPGRADKDVRATINACRLLLEKENTEHRNKLAKKIRETNASRKERVNGAKRVPGRTMESEHAAVYIVDGLSGLTGLYANKIRHKDKKAVGVFAKNEKDESQLVGSFRCLSPCHVDSLLEKEKNRRINGGGHEKAIGRTIPSSAYFQVATDFISLIEGKSLNQSEKKDDSIPLSLEDITRKNYRTLKEFEPFGEGFPSPVFSVDVEKEWGKLSTNGKSMIFTLPGRKEKAIYFGSLDCLKETRYSYFTITGRFKYSRFQGKDDVCLMSDEICPHL